MPQITYPPKIFIENLYPYSENSDNQGCVVFCEEIIVKMFPQDKSCIFKKVFY